MSIANKSFAKMGAMNNVSGPLRGWAVSLLLHAIALAWLVQRVPAPRSDDTPVPRSTPIFVRLQPKPLPPPTKPEPSATARPAPARAPAKPVRPAPRPAIASMAPSPTATAALPPPASAEPSAAAPGFDIDAARATARAVAGEPDIRAKNGTALRETKEERFGRAVEQARRKDCKTRYSGMGVLAIIPLVKDTVTDTGCKW
jgi:hypothetical protein